MSRAVDDDEEDDEKVDEKVDDDDFEEEANAALHMPTGRRRRDDTRHSDRSLSEGREARLRPEQLGTPRSEKPSTTAASTMSMMTEVSSNATMASVRAVRHDFGEEVGSGAAVPTPLSQPPSALQGHRPSRSETRGELLLRRQLQFLSAVSSMSVVLLLYFFLQPAAFFMLVVSLASAATLVLHVYLYALYHFQLILANGGFLQYLPKNVQELMTRTTLHDLLSDDALVREYSFVAFYFLPGVSQDQRRRMMQRLPRRHREMLFRPGAGQMFLPPALLRLLFPPDVALGDGTPRLTENPSAAANHEDVSAMEVLGGLYSNMNSLVNAAGTTSFSDELEDSLMETQQPYTATATPAVEGDLVWDEDEDERVPVENRDLPPLEVVGQRDGVQARRERDGVAEDASDLGVSVDGDNGPAIAGSGHLPRTLGTSGNTAPGRSAGDRRIVTQSVARSRQLEDDDDDDDEEEEDYTQLVLDAFSAMANSFSTLTAYTVKRVLGGTLESLTPGVVRTGMWMSSTSGLGLLALYYVRFHSQLRSSSNGTRLAFLGALWTPGNFERGLASDSRVSSGLYSTFLLGSTMSGIVLLIREWIRRSSSTSSLPYMAGDEEEEEGEGAIDGKRKSS